MAHMDIHFGYSVNGVAYLHTCLLYTSYRGNERADKRVEEVLAKHDPASRILVLPEFIPCQKALSETDRCV